MLVMYRLLFYKAIKSSYKYFDLYEKILEVEKDLTSLDIKEVVFGSLNFEEERNEYLKL